MIKTAASSARRSNEQSVECDPALLIGIEAIANEFPEESTTL